MNSESLIATSLDDPQSSAPQPPELSIIVPCYNEKRAIETVLRDFPAQLAGVDRYEVIVVDDGSSDGTSTILDGLSKELSYMRLLRHPTNLGYGAALKTGIRASRSPFVAITDSDGTYPNDRLPDLLKLARDGTDMVVGARIGEGVVYSKLRAFPKLFMRRYCEWVTRRSIPDMNSGLRVFRREAVARYLSYLPDSFSFTTTITIALMTNHHSVEYVPISYARRIGASKISPIKDTLRFSQLIVRTALYFAPLRVFGPMVAGLWIISLGMLGYDFYFRDHMADKTFVVFSLSLNATILALLADMIDKRLS